MTKGLLFMLNHHLTPGANRLQDGFSAFRTTAGLINCHWLAESELMKDCLGKQKLVRRYLQALAEFFQCQNGRRCFPACDVAKIPGAELAALGSALIGKMLAVANE